MSNLLSLTFVCAICVLGLSAQLKAAEPCPELGFGTPSYIPSGVETSGLATGDLNGDGKADLVTTNEGSGTIRVSFGDGTGAFPSALQFPAITPSAVAIADFSRDGILDLVTTSRNTHTITVRLGTGGGAFGAPVQTFVGPWPAGIATGDFNRDGNIDIVVSNSGGSTLSLLLGNAGGSFPAATSLFLIGSGPWGIVMADFNGDGNQDLATTNRGSANMSVLMGNGTGDVSSLASYPAGPSVSGIATRDFNGDGKLDLVTANTGSNDLTVRLNNGFGGFLTAVTLPTGGLETFSVAAADLDNDANADIIATNRRSNNVLVFRGNGDGTFAARTDFAVNSGPRSLIAADLNGDGSVDLATGVDSGNLAVLLNSCSENEAPTISSAMVTREQDGGSANSTLATVTDDQDDPDDLSVTVNGSSSATVNSVTVSNIGVDASGNVTADVSASCGASDAMFTLTVTDSGDLSATTKLTVNVTDETTSPVINNGDPIPDITVYLPVGSSDVSMPVSFNLPTATDNCSALPTVTSVPVSGSTFGVGSTVVTVTATDELDNTATATFTVKVLYSFGGFLRPLDPFPILNIATAGSSIPVKFSLSGDKGLNILAPGYPASALIGCSEEEPGSTVEETMTPGAGSLTYDPLSDQYTYVWKTSKDWKGTCRILILRLADGSEHYAKLRFK